MQLSARPAQGQTPPSACWVVSPRDSQEKVGDIQLSAAPAPAHGFCQTLKEACLPSAAAALSLMPSVGALFSLLSTE